MASVIFFSTAAAVTVLAAASATGVRSISRLESVVMEFFLPSLSPSQVVEKPVQSGF
jgi:hypothetical protein